MSHNRNNSEFLDDPDDKVADLLTDPDSVEVSLPANKYAPREQIFKVKLPSQTNEDASETPLPDLSKTIVMTDEPEAPAEGSKETTTESPVEESTDAPEDQPVAETAEDPEDEFGGEIPTGAEDESSEDEVTEDEESTGELPAPDTVPASDKKFQVTTGQSEDAEELKSEEEEDRSSRLFWILLLSMLGVLIIGLAYLCYDQYRMLPPDPLEIAEQKYKKTTEIYHQRLTDSFEVEKAKIMNEALAQKREAVQIREQNVALKETKIADLEREILGVSGQMKAYFKRYCEFTRRKAKDLHFDTIQTERSKKTFLDVSIQHVTKDYVSIVHSGGATRLSPSELSPALRERLAYGDPLGIRELDRELKEMKLDHQREEQRLPKAYGPEERQAIAEKLMNIPQPTPKTETSDSIEPPSKAPRVETK